MINTIPGDFFFCTNHVIRSAIPLCINDFLSHACTSFRLTNRSLPEKADTGAFFRHPGTYICARLSNPECPSILAVSTIDAPLLSMADQNVFLARWILPVDAPVRYIAFLQAELPTEPYGAFCQSENVFEAK